MSTDVIDRGPTVGSSGASNDALAATIAARCEAARLRHLPELYGSGLGNVRNAFEPWDEGTLDPARHPTRAFDPALTDDPWSGERARERDGA